jgi:hypothetical protein
MADAFHGAVRSPSEQVNTPHIFWQVTVCRALPDDECTMRLRNFEYHHWTTQLHVSNTNVTSPDLTKLFFICRNIYGRQSRSSGKQRIGVCEGNQQVSEINDIFLVS